MATRGELSDHARRSLKERLVYLKQCSRSDKDMERTRFYMRPEELIEVIEHCLQEDVNLSMFCRNAVKEKIRLDIKTQITNRVLRSAEKQND